MSITQNAVETSDKVLEGEDLESLFESAKERKVSKEQIDAEVSISEAIWAAHEDEAISAIMAQSIYMQYVMFGVMHPENAKLIQPYLQKTT